MLSCYGNDDECPRMRVPEPNWTRTSPSNFTLLSSLLLSSPLSRSRCHRYANAESASRDPWTPSWCLRSSTGNKRPTWCQELEMGRWAKPWGWHGAPSQTNNNDPSTTRQTGCTVNTTRCIPVRSSSTFPVWVKKPKNEKQTFHEELYKRCKLKCKVVLVL